MWCAARSWAGRAFLWPPVRPSAVVSRASSRWMAGSCSSRVSVNGFLGGNGELVGEVADPVRDDDVAALLLSRTTQG